MQITGFMIFLRDVRLWLVWVIHCQSLNSRVTNLSTSTPTHCVRCLYAIFTRVYVSMLHSGNASVWKSHLAPTVETLKNLFVHTWISMIQTHWIENQINERSRLLFLVRLLTSDRSMFQSRILKSEYFFTKFKQVRTFLHENYTNYMN